MGKCVAGSAWDTTTAVGIGPSSVFGISSGRSSLPKMCHSGIFDV